MKRIFPASIFLCFLLLTGCENRLKIKKPKSKPDKVKILFTGYCNCKKCTGWKYNWRFKKVYAYGPLKGKEKEIGVTANGSEAKLGSAAADTKFYPFGTIIEIPKYGLAKVTDRGGAIQGPYRVDLWFPDHESALKWGKRRLKAKVWKP